MKESNIYVLRVMKCYLVNSYFLESKLNCFVDMLSEIDCVNSMLVHNKTHIID